MTFLEIERAGPLSGTLMMQGSKNTVLPILAAALLAKGKTELCHVPRISDVEGMIHLLILLGCRVEWNKDRLVIDASDIRCCEPVSEITKSMRSSVNLLAPLLYRCHEVRIHQPGGCSLGNRPINLHLAALEKFGAVFEEKGEQICGKASGFCGTEICFPFVSVGATQQAVTAAAAAKGKTWISNCAKEPEVVELCRFLCAMGAKIEGIGTSNLAVTGIKEFRPVRFRIAADRIAAATYMSAAAICGGEICLSEVNPQMMEGITAPFIQMGCKVAFDSFGMTVSRNGRLKPISYIETEPYPGFPTDVQSLLLAVLTQADGRSIVKENIFNSRFRAANQLQKMGARIIINNNCAKIAYSRLIGTNVEAPDLRGGAALAIAGLAAEGTTRITGYDYIKRGYESIAQDLSLLGASASVVTIHSEDDKKEQRQKSACR